MIGYVPVPFKHGKMSVSMTPTCVRDVCVLIPVFGALLLAHPAAAQAPAFAIGLAAGPAPYDLAGTGTGLAGGLRGEYRPLQYLGAQVGIAYFKYTTGGGVGLDYLLPELSITGRLPVGPVTPYLGGGVGASFELEGQDDEALTLHAVLGANVAVGAHVETVTEARLRSIDPWTGNTLDVLFGLGWRF